ncbi:MAG: DEAD/DEAH box helicase [Chitinophagaceae bacterium]|nr:MAG: DEAD/DEAH box helicase [Chitinophagaceae bacterium]
MSQRNFSTETILTNLRIDALNEMQEATITAAAETNNLVLLSPTGSGKTLAFLLPLVNSLDASNKKSQALIIVPSRELALQIETVFKSMGTGLKVTTCYGGHKREIEENNLLQPPALLIGTPGRLADHIRRENISTDAIHTLVLDEFDKSLESGFVETLFRLLCHLGARPSIIFCNHREAVERTSNLLAEKGIINTFYHGAMEQRDREVALAKFRNGSVNFLVTTDLAARGLDIPNIRYIIHYHLPTTEDVFTHRNGRTARMDKTGTAILILAEDEKLPSYINTPVENIKLPDTKLLRKP